MCLRTRIMFRVRRNLCDRDMARRLREFLEFSIGDWIAIHPERADRHDVGRSLLGVMPVRAHAKRAARYPDHAWRLHICQLLAGARRAVTISFVDGRGRGTCCFGWQHSAATTIPNEFVSVLSKYISAVHYANGSDYQTLNARIPQSRGCVMGAFRWDETRWRTGLPDACEPWVTRWLVRGLSVNETAKNTLQSEAGCIAARPKAHRSITPSCEAA
jgi:hypothetical protein